MEQVRVLIIDDDEASRAALASILATEGWQIELAALADEGLERLRQGGWQLVLANVSMSSLSGPLFELLKELATAGGPLRVLFLVPPVVGARVRQYLEELNLPHAAKPIHLHDFLEQVSDLLLGAGIIKEPLLRIHELADAVRAAEQRKAATPSQQMFSTTDPAFSYTEEELRQFEEEERRKQEQQTKDEQKRY